MSTLSSTLRLQLPRNRNLELDGLRGWAALAVVLYHVFVQMLGGVVPEILSPLSYALLNGQYAVFIFFILSGDALSSQFFRHNDPRAIDRLAVKRYLRLTIPIFLSCFGVWVILTLGLDHHREASIVLRNEEWLGLMLQVDTSIYRLLKYVLYGVYAAHTPEHSYNPFLWTMSYELIGSFIVFLFCYVWRSLRYPIAVLGVAAVALLALNSFFFLFLFGMGLAYARSAGWLDRLRAVPRIQPAALLLVIAILALVGWRGANALPWPIAMSLCALIVLSVYASNWMRRFFSASLSLLLGKLSFSLYLTHLWVLIFPMSWLIVQVELRDRGGKLAFIAIGALCAALAVSIAWVFEFGERASMLAVDRFLKAHVLGKAGAAVDGIQTPERSSVDHPRMAPFS